MLFPEDLNCRQFARAAMVMLAILALAAVKAPGQEMELPEQMSAGEAIVVPMPAPQCAIDFSDPAEIGAPCPTPDGYAQQPWVWNVLPDGLIYRSYLAGVKEPRMSGVLVYERTAGWLLDATLGARVGLLRYGTSRRIWPEGWQLDVEGAAFPRLSITDQWDLQAADYRIGIPLTYGIGRYQMKIAWYHLSSHAGDEFLIKHPSFERINYSRDAIVWGHSFYPDEDLRLYAEIGVAIHNDGGSEPVEFQLGAEYSPWEIMAWGGAPFAAVNAQLRQEVDFGGDLVVQAGWQWRGDHNQHLLRAGFQFLTGPSNEFEFLHHSEQQYGMGLWYDF